MAEIELVIRIDEEDFNKMKHNVAIGKPICSLSEDKMVSKVANGIPLPIGHGRLKDIDDLDTTTIETEEYNGDEALEVVLREDIDDAPTIIPADTESEEEE